MSCSSQFKKGDEVWFIEFGTRIAAKGFVQEVLPVNEEDGVIVSGYYLSQKDIYSTRIELIEAQIKYWTNYKKLDEHF